MHAVLSVLCKRCADYVKQQPGRVRERVKEYREAISRHRFATLCSHPPLVRDGIASSSSRTDDVCSHPSRGGFAFLPRYCECGRDAISKLRDLLMESRNLGKVSFLRSAHVTTDINLITGTSTWHLTEQSSHFTSPPCLLCCILLLLNVTDRIPREISSTRPRPGALYHLICM